MAKTTTWTGVSGGAWNTAGNWSNGIPVDDDTAIVSFDVTTANYFINVNKSIGNLVKLTVGDSNVATPQRIYLAGANISTPGTTWNISSTVELEVPNQLPSGIAVSLASTVTGTGKIRKTGNGTFYFSAETVNTWSGGLDLDAGTVYYGILNNNLGSGLITMATGTGLQNASFITAYSLSNSLLINGNVSLNGNNAGFTTSQATTISGPVDLGGGTRTITSNTPTTGSGAVTLSGVISNGGLTKAGTATLTLSAANTLTGTVTSSAGTLAINNASALQDAQLSLAGAGSVTFAQNLSIGALVGSGNWTITGRTITLGGVNTAVSGTFSGNFGTYSGNLVLIMNSVSASAVQTFSGASSVSRFGSTEDTTITRGVIRLTTVGGLYRDTAVTATTTVSAGNTGGFWFDGINGTPNLGPITINGTGNSLNGALRNVSGNTTLVSTVTLGSSATIQSDGGTLTLGALALGAASTLTLTTTSTGGITLGSAASGSGTSKVIVSNGSTVKAGSTTIVSGSTVPLWQVTGTFDANNYAQTVAATKTLQVNGTWAGSTTTTTIAGTLDGTGSMTGSGTVSISSGGALKAGNGAANATLSIAGGLTFATGTQTMTLPGGTGLTLSKVAVAGALTLDGTVTLNATGASWTSGTTHTALTYESKSGAGSFSAGTLTGGSGRQGIGNIVVGATATTFDVVAGNTTVTWAGGDSGNWYNGQTTGWSGGDTGFLNGDTVTFGSGNTTTATLTSDVTVAAMIMISADHTVARSSSQTLTNSGLLTVAGTFTQTLNVPGSHGSISIASGSRLAVGVPGALGGTGTLTLNATTSLFGRLRFDAGVGASFSTNVPITLTTGTGIVFLETAGTGVVATLNGILSAGTGGALAKTGSGVVSLTASNTYSAITRVGSLTTETAGENVLRVTPTALPSPNIEINAASILEIDNGSAPYTFTRAYGINANNYYVANRVAGAGGGFSSRGTGGATVSSNITFGTTTAEAKWIGPMYFGTALGTSQGRVTMSGTLNINATNTSTSAQTFYVFGNPSTEGGCATISNISAPNLTYACVMEKRGTGALRIDNLTYNFSPILNHYEGTFDCTTGISGTAFIDARPAANGVVFRVPVGEPATNFPSISNASNFAFECNASSSSTATVNFWNTGAGAQGIGSATVILSGSTGGVGKVTVTSGTGTGKIIKTGASAWELSYAYANLAAGFSGGVEVQAGLMKASKRYALGGGPITIKGGQLQFSDTSGNTLGTIASLSTAGATSTPRIILGA